MRIDWGKVIIGAGVGAGALLLYKLQPAKARVSVGDKVLVRTPGGGSMKLQVTLLDEREVTGEAYEIGLPSARPILTFPRENVLSFV